MRHRNILLPGELILFFLLMFLINEEYLIHQKHPQKPFVTLIISDEGKNSEDHTQFLISILQLVDVLKQQRNIHRPERRTLRTMKFCQFKLPPFLHHTMDLQ